MPKTDMVIEYKNDRPGVAASERSAETKPHVNEKSTSMRDYITQNHDPQLIEGLLPRGSENAVAVGELVRMAKCKNVRELQRKIAEERENGAAILSQCRDGGGYFLPDDGGKGISELREFICTLRSRAINTFAALRTARAELKSREGEQRGENSFASQGR